MRARSTKAWKMTKTKRTFSRIRPSSHDVSMLFSLNSPVSSSCTRYSTVVRISPCTWFYRGVKKQTTVGASHCRITDNSPFLNSTHQHTHLTKTRQCDKHKNTILLVFVLCYVHGSHIFFKVYHVVPCARDMIEGLVQRQQSINGINQAMDHGPPSLLIQSDTFSSQESPK